MRRHVLPPLLLSVALLLAACSSGSGGGGGTTPDAGGTTYVKSYSVAGQDFEPQRVAATADGGSFQLGVVGLPVDGRVEQRLAVLRLDDLGNVVWARAYGRDDVPATVGEPVGAIEAADGTIWAAGKSADGGTVVHLSASGELLSRQVYGSAEQPVSLSAIAAYPGGGFVLAGTRQALNSEARRELRGGDLFLVYANAAGVTETQISNDVPGEVNADQVNGLRVDGNGEVTVYGAQGTFNVFGSNESSLWIARYGVTRTLTFSSTHSPLIRTGYAHGAVTLPRLAGSTADRPSLIVVGSNEDSLGTADPEPRLVYLHLPDGERIQGEDLDADDGELESQGYNGIAAGGGNVNRVVVSTNVSGRACDDCRFEFHGLLQVLERQVIDGRPRFVEVARRLPGDYSLSEAATFRGLVPGREGEMLLTVGTRNGDRLLRLSTTDLSVIASTIPASAAPELVVGGVAPMRDGGLLAWNAGQLHRIDPAGNLGWTHQAAVARALYTRPADVAALADGSALVASNTTLPNGAGGDGVLLRFAADGGTGVVRRFDGLQFHDLEPIDLDGDGRDGDAVLAVITRNDGSAAAMRLRPDGTVIDTRAFSGGEDPTTQPASRSANGILVPTTRGATWFGRDGAPTRSWRLNDAFDGRLHATADGGAWRVVAFGGSERFDSRVVRYGSDGAVVFSGRPVIEAIDRAGDGHVPRVVNGFVSAARADGGLFIGANLLAPVPEDASVGALTTTCDDPRRCTDIVAFALGADGTPGWAQAWGAARGEYFTSRITAGGALAQPDNGVLMTGGSTSYVTPRQSVFAVRTDADGFVSSQCTAELRVPLQLRVDALTAGAVADAVLDPPGFSDAAAPPSELIDFATDVLRVDVARSCSGNSQAPSLIVTSSGEGRVVSSIAGIDCPGDCEQTYATGTMVQLTASYDDGQRFAGWTGDCAAFGTTTPITLTLGANQRCGAAFTPTTTPPPTPDGRFDLEVALVGPGGTTGHRIDSFPYGIFCESGSTTACTQSFASGRVVLQVSRTAPDHRFVGWDGCDRVVPHRFGPTQASSCEVDGTTGRRFVQARFIELGNAYEVRVSAINTTFAPGRIVSTPAGLDCNDLLGQTPEPAGCRANFESESVRLAAIPDPGRYFGAWSGCDALLPQDPGEPPLCVLRDNGENRYADAIFVAGPGTSSLAASFTTGSVYGGEPVANANPARVDGSTSTPGAYEIIAYAWDWENDGRFDCQSTQLEPLACAAFFSAFEAGNHTYNAPGTYTIRLRVTDAQGRNAETTRSLVVR